MNKLQQLQANQHIVKILANDVHLLIYNFTIPEETKRPEIVKLKEEIQKVSEEIDKINQEIIMVEQQQENRNIN